jgi:hypothetical protein
VLLPSVLQSYKSIVCKEAAGNSMPARIVVETTLIMYRKNESSALFQFRQHQLGHFLQRLEHAHTLNRHAFEHRLAFFLQLLR